MKELHHICYTSHDEVMYRDKQDHDMYINLLALRVFSGDIDLYADAEMSDHTHLCARMDKPSVKCGWIRHSYTSYFNAKYHRIGRLGEPRCFVSKLVGQKHIATAISYILRNGLHHGVAATAFGYPYSSIHEMFANDIIVPGGRYSSEVVWLPEKSQYPKTYVMNEKGMFLRSSFMEIKAAESYFVTPRNFLYMMNRLSDDRWKNEQLGDGNSVPPITLASAEPSFLDNEVADLLSNETGRRFDPLKLDDLELCRIIDTEIVPKYNVHSIYKII